MGRRRSPLFASAWIVPAHLWIPCGLGGQDSPHPGDRGLGVWGFFFFSFVNTVFVSPPPACREFTSLKEAGILFIQQRLPKALSVLLTCSSAFVPARCGDPVARIRLHFFHEQIA